MLDIHRSPEEAKRQRKQRAARIVVANKRRLLEALHKNLGNVTLSCEACKLHPSTFYRYQRNDKEFAKAAEAVENTAHDFVEGHLMKNIKNGNAQCQIFYARTRMRHRGYGEPDRTPNDPNTTNITAGAGGQGLDLSSIEDEIPEDSIDDILEMVANERGKNRRNQNKNGG